MHYIIRNAFVHHSYIYCGHPYGKIGSYVDLEGGNAKITDLNKKSRKSHSENMFFRKLSTFPRIENLKQGVFGGL